MFCEHHLAGGAKCRSNVRVATKGLDVVDGVEHRLAIAVSVKMEHDHRIGAELHQADLRQISVDGEGAYDPFSEAEDLDVPVVPGLFDDACRLIKHQHYVGRPSARYYDTHTFNIMKLDK